MERRSIGPGAAAVACAVALVMSGCGDDGQSEVDRAEERAREATKTLEREAEDLRRELREGAPADEVRQRADELERRARERGGEIEKEAKELERELREQLP